MFKIYNIFFRKKERKWMSFLDKIDIFILLFIPLFIFTDVYMIELALLFIYFILKLYLSFLNMNGIFTTKDLRNDYLKFSNNSAKLLKNIMIADLIKRLLPTLIFVYAMTIFTYEYINIPAIASLFILVLGISQFTVFFGYFMRGSEKCMPILILGSFIMGVVLYIVSVNETNTLLLGVLAVLGLILIIAKFIISFRKVDKLYG